MRILIVNPFSSFKLSGIRFKLPNPSLATVYAIIQKAGYNADLCDLQALEEPDIDLVDRFLCANQYDLIGITVGLDTLEHISEIVNHIKQEYKEIPIVIGGTPIAYQPELWLRETGADLAVIGEAEETLPELILAIKSGSDLNLIKGIIYKKDSKLFVTPPRPKLKNLQNAPFPDYSLFRLESYFKNPNFKWHFNGKKGLYLIVSRGCNFRCSFCCSGLRRRASYETDRILDEIKHIVDAHKLEALFIRDDLFTIDPERTRAISRTLGKIGISWNCLTRPNLVCREGDSELLKYMASNGCETIMIGIESYNQKILDLNCKDIKIPQINDAIENCQKANLRTIAFIIFGLPGESEESIKQTLQFLEKSDVEFSNSILQVLPGSKIYSDALRQNKITDEAQYLKVFHCFWDSKDYLPINMTSLPDQVIIDANKEADKMRLKSKFFNKT